MKRWALEIVEVMLLYVASIMYCKSGGSRSPRQLTMELIEKIILEKHRDEFSATSGRSNITPSPLSSATTLHKGVRKLEFYLKGQVFGLHGKQGKDNTGSQ
ncbi:piggyBac transposable element-derived protein 4 [Trichonephila clavipes]|nr:piggyBac transposable element-derived protein 4 [Trichonephila clavipes]